MKTLLCLFSLFITTLAYASPLDGEWIEVGSGTMVEIVSFQGLASFHSTSYYSNGAEVDWTFEFQIPMNGTIQPNRLLAGSVRSQDGYYGCSFREAASAMLDEEGHFKVHYPLLTYVLENGRCVVTERNWVTNLLEKL